MKKPFNERRLDVIKNRIKGKEEIVTRLDFEYFTIQFWREKGDVKHWIQLFFFKDGQPKKAKEFRLVYYDDFLRDFNLNECIFNDKIIS